MEDKSSVPPLFSGGRLWNSYSSYLRQRFGGRVQKISLHAGLSCPNRDGSKGRGGCTYCNNDGFVPAYCRPRERVEAQLSAGMAFFRDKYPAQQYLAYFQAYSNTYAGIRELRQLYLSALRFPGVCGIIISTRPDCLPAEVLDLLREIAHRHYLKVEIGVESTCNASLKRVNRCHTWEESADAIERTAAKGIEVGAHLILGLPGETQADMMRHAHRLNRLPLQSIKLHQLQILRHSPMGRAYLKKPRACTLFSLPAYIDTVIDFTERLRPGLMIERFGSEAPSRLLLAPRWKLKNFELTARIEQRMAERHTWQGRLF